jgi:hypothetical protein
MEILVFFLLVLCILISEGYLFYKAITRLLDEREREESIATRHISRTLEENTSPNKILPHETPIGSPRRRLFPEKTDSSAVSANKNGAKTPVASGTGGGPWRRFRTWWSRTTR